MDFILEPLEMGSELENFVSTTCGNFSCNTYCEVHCGTDCAFYKKLYN